ncbi:hypothetical protein [Salegentibacter sp. F14]
MSQVVPVFQFEVRYDHILNFSQIARKIVAPYVRLSQSIKIENQNTVEERIILNFEEEDYLIIVSWDRILIKGQNSLNPYLSKNSPIQIPFLAILDRLKDLEEFGSIKNALFAATYIKEFKIEKDEIFSKFSDKYLNSETQSILDTSNDLAITLVDRGSEHETTVSLGPYLGTVDLTRRAIRPLNYETLDETEFLGIMLEYKHGYSTSNITFDDFVKLTKSSNKTFERSWKML